MILRSIFLLVTIFTGGFFGMAQIVTTQAPGRQTPAQRVVVLRNARVIDGTGAAPQDHVSLLLRNGKAGSEKQPLLSCLRTMCDDGDSIPTFPRVL